MRLRFTEFSQGGDTDEFGRVVDHSLKPDSLATLGEFGCRLKADIPVHLLIRLLKTTLVALPSAFCWPMQCGHSTLRFRRVIVSCVGERDSDDDHVTY